MSAAPRAGTQSREVVNRGCRRRRAQSSSRVAIFTHYAKSVKLVELATVCETSPFHLVPVSATPSNAPHAYAQVRSNHARDMLLRGVRFGAAYRCGFADQSR
jgi:AraC-like DNA-binding protein